MFTSKLNIFVGVNKFSRVKVIAFFFRDLLGMHKILLKCVCVVVVGFNVNFNVIWY